MFNNLAINENDNLEMSTGSGGFVRLKSGIYKGELVEVNQTKSNERSANIWKGLEFKFKVSYDDGSHVTEINVKNNFILEHSNHKADSDFISGNVRRVKMILKNVDLANGFEAVDVILSKSVGKLFNIKLGYSRNDVDSYNKGLTDRLFINLIEAGSYNQETTGAFENQPYINDNQNRASTTQSKPTEVNDDFDDINDDIPF